MCVNWKTGETVYEVAGTGRGGMTFADGLLYFVNESNDVRLIRPNPERYELISGFKLPADGEGPTWAHPVVHDQKLYLRHGSFLYCYDIARP